MDYIKGYFNLYADCIPVKGASKSIIMDLGRKNIYEISNETYDLISNLSSEKMGIVFKEYTNEEVKEEIIPIVEKLISIELGHIINNPAEFPKINLGFHDHGGLNDAIIDVKDTKHDFIKIFKELDDLKTRYLEIRFFRKTDITEIIKLLDCANKTSFYSIKIICYYDKKLSSEIVQLIKRNPIITSFTFTNSKINKINNVYQNEKIKKSPISRIIFTKQEITSCDNCGVINQSAFTIPDVQRFAEYNSFNSCLNKKVSIDINGEIKNCPSMKIGYGKHKDISLAEVVEQKSFKSLWSITKNNIQGCKDCEYRYICTDCRAYVEDINNDKPLKCGYNPYKGEWNQKGNKAQKNEKI